MTEWNKASAITDFRLVLVKASNEETRQVARKHLWSWDNQSRRISHALMIDRPCSEPSVPPFVLCACMDRRNVLRDTVILGRLDPSR